MLIAAKQHVVGLNATEATVAVVNQANRVQAAECEREVAGDDEG